MHVVWELPMQEPASLYATATARGHGPSNALQLHIWGRSPALQSSVPVPYTSFGLSPTLAQSRLLKCLPHGGSACCNLNPHSMRVATFLNVCAQCTQCTAH